MHASTGVCVCGGGGGVKCETVQHNSLCTHLIVNESNTCVQRFEQTSSEHLRPEEWGTQTNIVRV